MSDKIQVLFVCLGNICRSPMAEGVFQHLVQEQGLSQHFFCDSAGTSQYHIGEQPDRRTLETLEMHGIGFRHAARQFVRADYDRFDYILAMDRNNRKDMLALQQDGHVRLMREWDELAESPDVPDPYWGDLREFEEVYQMLDRACRKLLAEICAERGLTPAAPQD